MRKPTNLLPPDCPSCGDNRAVYDDGDRNYFCRTCRQAFGDVDEGGTYYTDPTRRAELADERAKRKRQQVAARAALPPGFRFSGNR